MKLDDVALDSELSLDVTPLIDIVFLLVLFFAVSTSFISGEDLSGLLSDVDQKSRQVEQLQREGAKLRWMIDALQEQQAALQKSLADQNSQNRSLREQLEQAFRDFNTLQVKVKALENTVEQKSASEQTLRSSLDAQHSRNEQLTAEVLRLRQELDKLQEILAMDRAQIERILQAQEQLKQGLDDYLEANEVGLKREKERLILQLSDKLLFDSGSAEIKPGGLKVLRRVGQLIKSRMGQIDVQVAGHTDNVPLSRRREMLLDNWSLSAARAVNIVRFLEREVGLDPRHLAALGYGEHRPIASNDTPRGRALNRRIDLILVPR